MPFATGAFKNEDLGFVSHPPAPKVFFWGFLGFARKPSCRAVVRQAHYERSFVSTVRPEYLYVREADRAYESDYGVRFSIRSLSPPPEVRPLPWREAERIGVGGFPQVPTKEGSALSGLSHRTGNGADKGSEGFPSSPTKEGSALSGLSYRTGNGADKGSERFPKRAPPSLDSPTGRGMERTKGRSGSHKPHQGGLRPLWTLLPDGEWSEQGSERFPQAPPKRVPPSLDSPAGRGNGAGKSRRGPLKPHQRGLRPLWTLPPDWEWSGQRGGGVPSSPTKEGSALSGLSRRREALRVASATMCNRSNASSPSSA